MKLTDTETKRLKDYLSEEIRIAKAEVLEPLQNKRKLWDDKYYGVVGPRRLPWMSNFPILMGATITDAITARLMNTIWAYRPIFKMEPTRGKEWISVAKNLEQFIDLKVRQEMRLYSTMRKSIFETVRLGTGALLTPWVKETTTRKAKVGPLRLDRKVTIRNFLQAQGLPIRDFLFPGGYAEVEDLPWWARRISWTAPMLRAMKAQGYEIPERVVKYLEPQTADRQDAQKNTGEEPDSTSRFVHLWEVWFKWDFDKAGEFKRYTCLFHEPTEEIISPREDTYPRWPLNVYRYGPRDYGLCGLGTMELALPYDDALYALYNTLVDNFKVATMQCFKSKRGQGGLRADDEIYPGKVFNVAETSDIEAFSLGNAYNLNPQVLQMIWQLGEKRTGVSDYTLGRESGSTQRATATGTLALIQEGQRRFDLTIRDIREEQDRMGDFMLQMMYERLDPKEPYVVKGDKGEYIEKFLTLPAEPPYLSVAVLSSMSHAALNKEVEKQDAMATFQILGQYYREIIQLMQGLLNPAAPPELKAVMVNIARAAGEKMKHVLESYGELSPEVYADVAEPITGTLIEGEAEQGLGAGLPGNPGMGLPQAGVAGPQGPMPPELAQMQGPQGLVPATGGSGSGGPNAGPSPIPS
jgi:hypothetical protein